MPPFMPPCTCRDVTRTAGALRLLNGVLHIIINAFDSRLLQSSEFMLSVVTNVTKVLSLSISEHVNPSC